jgi:PTS system cellobiose-specific IIC component
VVLRRAWFTGTGRAGQRHHDPWALENVALYQQYGSVDAALAAGKTFHVWAKPMLDSYIFLGGTGATLGLIIAVFIVSRRADYRQVAKLALPSGIFQINEPILFGLPIIMNPVMFIPFILIQPLLAAITLTAYYMGIIPPVTNIAPWTMPAGLGAFFNTNGSVAAFLLAIFNLGLQHCSTCRSWRLRTKLQPSSMKKRAKKILPLTEILI